MPKQLWDIRMSRSCNFGTFLSCTNPSLRAPPKFHEGRPDHRRLRLLAPPPPPPPRFYFLFHPLLVFASLRLGCRKKESPAPLVFTLFVYKGWGLRLAQDMTGLSIFCWIGKPISSEYLFPPRQVKIVTPTIATWIDKITIAWAVMPVISPFVAWI